MAQPHTSEGASESVSAVWFSFFTNEEVRKHSFVKITNPILLDDVEIPVPGGLYDPALGPLEDRELCKSCGQSAYNCPGHYGHIDLIYPVYNPLLFNILYKLVQNTCFFCYHFMAGELAVKKCVAQLELILKSDIIGARDLESNAVFSKTNRASSPKDHDGSEYCNRKHFKQQEWTSLHFTEAMSVINNFLRPSLEECENCEAKRVKMIKPTFGWIHLDGIDDKDARANALKGCNLDGPLAEGELFPEVDIGPVLYSIRSIRIELVS